MDNLTPTPPAPAPGTGTMPPRDGWAVSAGRGAGWWSGGWRLFTLAPLNWIAITVVFGAIMIGLGFVPFLGMVAQTLLYPVLVAGVLIGAREQDRGNALSVAHLFACFNEKAWPLVILALVYVAGWVVLSLVLFALAFGLMGFGTLSSLFSGIQSGDPMEALPALAGTLSAGTLVIVLVMTIGVALLFMAYWFAPALVIFRGDEPLGAMRASFNACMRNVPPFLVYSLIGIGLAVVASIPFGLGWFVLLPVYGASMYASYKDVFGEP